LGANFTAAGNINFAVFAGSAEAVSLCFFTKEDLEASTTTCEIPLDPVKNKTGSVWHVEVPDVEDSLLYGYRVKGPFNPHQGQRHDPEAVVLDPYACTVVSRPEYGVPAVGKDGVGQECWPQMASALPSPVDDFDWEGDRRLQHAEEDLIVYEMHVRGFTADATSGAAEPGTYKAMMERLPYLAEMGFTALELMPIHEFNELEYYSLNPATGEFRFNFWGYSTVGFNSPMLRYAAVKDQDNGRAAVRELKELVKQAHLNGMEVILDVVYNHTAEGNELGPVISFRGLGNQVYYVVAPEGQFYNYSGCGNTFNCNHPVVRKFILDSLRYWVTEFHIDGFRFDLASIMTRASSNWDYQNMFGESSVHFEEGWDGAVVTGTPLGDPPLIDMISSDPVLKGTRLIAEAWDAGGLYQVGTFPHHGRWAEWNGKFRDTARNFLKGTDSTVGAFAEALCGSPELYSNGRRPYHSVNFVTAHDGFTMMDNVSYNEKANHANGEDNRDGEEHNLSWNCGTPEEEGDNALPATVNLRQRQFRNHFVALLVAQGTPMILMGDEYGHSKKGNNNTYCHDNELNYFKWDQLEEDEFGYARLVRNLINLRLSHSMLRMTEFPTEQSLTWHGEKLYSPNWEEDSRLVAYTLNPPFGNPDPPLYIAFNSGFEVRNLELPKIEGRRWVRVLDTSMPAPFDFSNDEIPAELLYASELQMDNLLAHHAYPMMPQSSIVLKAIEE